MLNSRPSRFVFGLILLLSVLAFASLWHAPFLTWDDDSNISANPYYAAGRWIEFWRAPYFGLYVPLTNTTWQILYVLGHGAAWPYRVFNSALHLTNVVLAYIVLRGLSRRWGVTSPWPVLAGLGLFAFHPLQVEAVAWISGGRDLLATLLALLTLIVYYRRESWLASGISTVLFAAAMLAKPNCVVLPALILGLDFWWGLDRRRSVVTAALWGLAAAVPVWLTVEVQAEHFTAVEPWLRPWVMLDTYSFYLRKLLWPWPLNANYARPPDYVLAHEHTLFIGLGFLLGLALALAWAWRRDRRFLFGLTWLLLLFPVSGVVPFGYQKISTIADHYHYLPMLAVGAVVMLLLEHMVAVWRGPILTGTAAIGILLFTVTCLRVPAWASNRAFFGDMADYNPHSFAAAIGMSIVSCVDLEDFDAGVGWTTVALGAKPNDVVALANQAYCYLHAKNYIRVTELEYYLNRMNLNDLEVKQPTGYASLLASIGTSEMEIHNFELGYQYLCEAYRIKPAEPSYRRNLEIATQMLKDAHMTPRCDPHFQVAPGDDGWRDEDGEPGDD